MLQVLDHLSNWALDSHPTYTSLGRRKDCKTGLYFRHGFSRVHKSEMIRTLHLYLLNFMRFLLAQSSDWSGSLWIDTGISHLDHCLWFSVNLSLGLGLTLGCTSAHRGMPISQIIDHSPQSGTVHSILNPINRLLIHPSFWDYRKPCLKQGVLLCLPCSPY